MTCSSYRWLRKPLTETTSILVYSLLADQNIIRRDSICIVDENAISSDFPEDVYVGLNASLRGLIYSRDSFGSPNVSGISLSPLSRFEDAIMLAERIRWGNSSLPDGFDIALKIDDTINGELILKTNGMLVISDTGKYATVYFRDEEDKFEYMLSK